MKFPVRRRVRLVRQTEASECALACIAMVATSYGSDSRLASLRAQFPVSARGVTLRWLIDIVTASGFSAQPLRLELAAMETLHLPAILHWKMDHFVVLEQIDRRGFLIHDPAAGSRWVGREQLSDQFTGIALELRPVELAEVASHGAPSLASVVGRQDGWSLRVAQLVLLNLVIQFGFLAIPYFIQITIDTVLPTRDLRILLSFAALFLLLYAVSTAVEAYKNWWITIHGMQLANNIMHRFVSKLLNKPIAWYERRSTGDILTRVASIGPIQQALTVDASHVISNLIIVVLGLALIFAYGSLVGWAVLAFSVVNAIVTVLTITRVRDATEQVLGSQALEHSAAIETIRSISAIRLFGKETERASSWLALFDDTARANAAQSRVTILFAAAQGLLSGVQTIAITGLCILLATQNPTFTAGMIIAILFYQRIVAERLADLLRRVTNLKMIDLHLNRLSDVVTSDVEQEENAYPTAHIDLSGQVSLQQVSFRYGSADREVVRGVDLVVADGDFIAITGPTGAGKTTILKIVAGLVEPTTGTLSSDGIPLTSSNLPSWRKGVATVLQDDVLLSGSIADNISFFDESMDIERVAWAAAAAGLAADVSHFPMKYWTWVGDMGAALSGGQRQRVLIARALYKNPRVLVLDEATAHLDANMERLIGDFLQTQTFTRIVAAHRPALIERANRVYEVRRGTLVQIR